MDCKNCIANEEYDEWGYPVVKLIDENCDVKRVADGSISCRRSRRKNENNLKGREKSNAV